MADVAGITRIYMFPFKCMQICFSDFFFFNDTATTEIYTLSLHDALPILKSGALPQRELVSIKSGGAAATRNGQYKKQGAAATRDGQYKMRGAAATRKGQYKKIGRAHV